MTILALKKKKQELLASQVSRIASDTNDNLLRVNLSKFFTDLEHEIQSALLEYWNDHMLLQGQVNLILASIHEKHQEYYELIMKHKIQEFHRAEQLGRRLVKRQEQSAMKATKPVKITANRNNLFGTLDYSEDKLRNMTFTASENTLNRVDSNINEILLDGYRQGVGINEVSRQITERFDQLRTWEAKRIARTEIHTAQNMGVMNSYDSLGVEYTQWIAAGDARTRESHVEIDREIIPIGSTYSNGLAFPGDTSGPIEEWINCRCSNAPFVMPAGMMAPSFSPFREEDLVPIETEPIQTEPEQPMPITPEVQVTKVGIDNEVGFTNQNRFPEPVKKAFDNFAEQTAIAEGETMYLVASDGTIGPTNYKRGLSVGTSEEQIQWIGKMKEKGLDVYANHNHPNLAQQGRYDTLTLLSEADFDFFRNYHEHFGGNYVNSFSCEGPRNRMTVHKHIDTTKLEFSERHDVESKQYDAINNAYECIFDYDKKVNRGIKPSTKYIRQKKEELTSQGVDWRKNPDVLKPYEEQAKKLDEGFAEQELTKTIKKMNEILNPVGMSVTNEFRHLNKFKGRYKTDDKITINIPKETKTKPKSKSKDNFRDKLDSKQQKEYDKLQKKLESANRAFSKATTTSAMRKARTRQQKAQEALDKFMKSI